MPSWKDLDDLVERCERGDVAGLPYLVLLKWCCHPVVKPVTVVAFLFPGMNEKQIARVLATLVMATYENDPGPGALSESGIFGWNCSFELHVHIFEDLLTNDTHESRWWRQLRDTAVVVRDGKIELREKGFEDDDANYHGTEPSHLEKKHNETLSRLGNSIVFGNRPITMAQLHRQLIEGDTIGVTFGEIPFAWSPAQHRWRFDPATFGVRREKSPEDAQAALEHLYRSGNSILDRNNPFF